MQILKTKLLIRAGAKLDDWGTPDFVLNIVRAVCGPITIDLASNRSANARIGAREFYSKSNSCPEHVPIKTHSVVWCNPPGPVEKVRWFWDRWCECIANDATGGFLIFNLDHWRTLGAPAAPLFVCILRQRLRFVGAESQFHHPSALVLSEDPRATYVGNVVQW
jgi:hypothetical protein